MNLKHPNRGDCYERTKHNPLEKALADHWESENKPRHFVNSGHGVLQDLFIKGTHLFPIAVHKVTKRERWIVATVIQWLGSNCGQSFLQEAFRKAGFKIERIKS